MSTKTTSHDQDPTHHKWIQYLNFLVGHIEINGEVYGALGSTELRSDGMREDVTSAGYDNNKLAL